MNREQIEQTFIEQMRRSPSKRELEVLAMRNVSEEELIESLQAKRKLLDERKIGRVKEELPGPKSVAEKQIEKEIKNGEGRKKVKRNGGSLIRVFKKGKREERKEKLAPRKSVLVGESNKDVKVLRGVVAEQAKQNAKIFDKTQKIQENFFGKLLRLFKGGEKQPEIKIKNIIPKSDLGKTALNKIMGKQTEQIKEIRKQQLELFKEMDKNKKGFLDKFLKLSKEKQKKPNVLVKIT